MTLIFQKDDFYPDQRGDLDIIQWYMAYTLYIVLQIKTMQIDSLFQTLMLKIYNKNVKRKYPLFEN